MPKFLILALVLSSCSLEEKVSPIYPTIGEYTVKTIDGCEYLEKANKPGYPSSLYSLTHKGNCSNLIHQCK